MRWAMPPVVIATMLAATGAAQAATVRVEVSGAAPDGTTIYVALCEGALRRAACRPGGSTAAISETVRLSIMDISPGDYALLVFQDRNGNDRLDRNLVGFPREPYALSNAPAGLPSFAKAAFVVKDGTNTVRTRLKQP